MPECRKLPPRWTINVCPACNGLVEQASRFHTGDCPNRYKTFAVRTVFVVPEPASAAPVAWRVEFCGDATRSPSWLLTSEASTAEQYRASGHVVEPLYRAAGREADRG
jgi:hypothetical protein